MSVEFGCLKAGQIDHFWPVCREMLRPAFSDRPNSDSIDDCFYSLRVGEAQLWVASRGQKIIGAALTSIEEGSAMRICNVHCLAGAPLKDWLHLFDKTITKFAQDNGCRAIESITRRGFMKLLPGLVETGVVYTKFL